MRTLSDPKRLRALFDPITSGSRILARGLGGRESSLFVSGTERGSQCRAMRHARRVVPVGVHVAVDPESMGQSWHTLREAPLSFRLWPGVLPGFSLRRVLGLPRRGAWGALAEKEDEIDALSSATIEPTGQRNAPFTRVRGVTLRQRVEALRIVGPRKVHTHNSSVIHRRLFSFSPKVLE